ncbi:transposase [Azospirillum sp. A1-3]|uniref:transposase n=1 Tax=Azospirillum sp. A1-3 TaxID=185874 RepID=UPI002573C85C|nr:transposase [Azospirillum sp. A1-3]
MKEGSFLPYGLPGPRKSLRLPPDVQRFLLNLCLVIQNLEEPEIGSRLTVVVDSCSVRAKRGGELTGPNPTDRGKSGTKYHVVVSTDGLPLAVVPSPANVHDTKLFPDLLRLAQVVCTAIGRLYADAGYDSADNRWLCLRDGVQPHIRKIGEPHGSGLGKVRCIVEHGCAWLLANKRLDRRQDRLARIILALLTAAAIFIIANRLSTF